MNEPNTFSFDSLILSLKSKKTVSDKERSALYKYLAEEARSLAAWHDQQDPNYRAGFKIETDGTF